MSRDHDGPPIQILYIGQSRCKLHKLWQQLIQDGIGVAFAATQRLGLQMAWDLKPLVVVINACNGAFTGERLCRALGRGLPNVQRLLLTEASAGSSVPCERHLPRPFTVGPAAGNSAQVVGCRRPARLARRKPPVESGHAHRHRAPGTPSADPQAGRSSRLSHAPPQPGLLPPPTDEGYLGDTLRGRHTHVGCAYPLGAREDRARSAEAASCSSPSAGSAICWRSPRLSGSRMNLGDVE